MNAIRPRISVWTVTIVLALAAGWGCVAKPIGPPDSTGRRPTWNQMTIDQRKAHMKQTVLPRAATLFRSWRPDRYAVVDCRLCHGQGAVSGRFHMPTAHLPRLSGELLLGPEFEKHPDTTRLKLDRLVPLMAEALGKPSFNILTRRGFGCYSCHLGPHGPLFGN
jgi:hypothetical protein